MFAIVSDFKWVEETGNLAITWQDEEIGLTVAVDKAKGENASLLEILRGCRCSGTVSSLCEVKD